MKIYIFMTIIVSVLSTVPVSATEMTELQYFQAFHPNNDPLGTPNTDLKLYNPNYRSQATLQTLSSLDSLSGFLHNVDIFSGDLNTDNEISTDTLLSKRSYQTKTPSKAESSLINELINFAIDELQNSPEALENMELWSNRLPIIRERIDSLLVKARLKGQTNQSSRNSNTSLDTENVGSPTAAGRSRTLPIENDNFIAQWRKRLTSPGAILIYIVLIIGYTVIHFYRERA